MIDVQNRKDNRNISIDRVGIKNIKYPITLRDKRKDVQHTIARVNLYVDLPREFKGTHMSRFVEVLTEHHQEIDIKNIKGILDEIKTRLKAKTAHLELTFPYFIEKKAPVSGQSALLDYNCTIEAVANGSADIKPTITVEVPVTTLCPCSKEISERGAHNQRSVVTLKVRVNQFIWLEELIHIVEHSASCELFPLLKREDEKYVTEEAYDNPAFVEDVVRNITEKLQDDERVDWFSVESENQESIHNHNAYAQIVRNLRAERLNDDKAREIARKKDPEEIKSEVDA
ncbi:MAG: GTP cyclohydrolase I FolE2 [candidate division Zixibacteria bacterium]|nr:GTP cyclohydrolase I FolE2 [candidate division Zixibacteria bacterium]NIR63445.1 GTP cyclohydrolase I FolE2 [candidate division Zixibacteria bacterium]NIS16153.1 GTP cyclohydrolase I FolE2 [candidate division Zixibacteria bacterium]NIS45397.1 GTP cyclohydrolase I FolE2 [candidate division Zixibacteria bacterium]NIT53911.1 GTP cyclohydrolase I FolE2 [candidate division Zixibacteria bacterium]